MSKNGTSNAEVVQEALHFTSKDGTLTQRFDPRRGKWGAPSGREGMAFDSQTGKLVVTSSNPDNYIAIPLVAAGFFME